MFNKPKLNVPRQLAAMGRILPFLFSQTGHGGLSGKSLNGVGIWFEDDPVEDSLAWKRAKIQESPYVFVTA
jgi:hypothetical protein